MNTVFASGAAIRWLGKKKLQRNTVLIAAGRFFLVRIFVRNAVSESKISPATDPALAPQRGKTCFISPVPDAAVNTLLPPGQGFPKWLFGLLGVVILAGVYYFWPKAPSKPLVVSPTLPPQTAPTTEKTDTLQRDVERLAERIRAAHMKKDMSLFLSCYSTSYPNLGELERQTYENWKNFDFKNVSYNISNLRRVGPNQAVADLVWSFQLFDNQTKSSEIRRAEVNVTFEESGGSWKIRDSKQKETG